MNSTRVVTWTGLILASIALAGRAEAIPAFARMHGVSCSMCHDPMPRLNAFGAAFVANGYRFAPNQPAPDVVATGDPLLQLPRALRLAMRLDAFATAYAGGEAMTDLQTPYNLKIMSGGPLASDFSYYIYFLLAERGATGGIEDAFVTWSEVAGSPVNLAVGQFGLSDPIFPRELRLEYQDYVIYRARIGNAPTTLTYDRGLMLSADVAGFALMGAVVNGNGNDAASTSRRFDDDRHKAFAVHVSRDVTDGVTLGALGYATSQTGAAPGGPATVNRLWMLGADATLTFGDLEVRGQFVHREDGSPTFTLDEARAVTNGGFGEVLWHPVASRWYAIALYNLIHTNRPLLDVRLGGPAGLTRYEAVTGGFGYLVQRNVRAYAEATWEVEARASQWTLGLTTAF